MLNVMHIIVNTNIFVLIIMSDGVYSPLCARKTI